MPILLTDPSFEDGSSAWTANGGNAIRSNNYTAHNGTWVYELGYRGSGRGAAGIVSQAVTLTPGIAHQLVAYVKSVSGSPGVILEADMTAGGGSDNAVVVTSGAMTRDWQQLSISFIPDGTGVGSVRIRAIGYLFNSTDILIADDLSLTSAAVPLMAQEALDGLRALFARLQTITKANGYYTDAGLRVLPRVVMPQTEDAGDEYLCVVAHEPGRFEFFDQGGSGAGTITNKYSIYAFFGISEGETVEQSSLALSLKLGSDLLRCMLPSSSERDWNFGNDKVRQVEILDHEARSEMLDGVPPHARLDVAISVMFMRSTLGPTA